MADSVLRLLANQGNAQTSRPKVGRKVQQRLRGNMQALLTILSSTAAVIGVFGANVPNAWAGRDDTTAFSGRRVTDKISGVTQAAVTDANAVASDWTFQTSIPFVAFANYNYLALGDEFAQLVWEPGVANGGFGVTDVGGFATLTASSVVTVGDGLTATFDLAKLALDLFTSGTFGLQVKVNGVQQVEGVDYTVPVTGIVLGNGERYTRVSFTVAPGAVPVTIQPYLKSGAQLGVSFQAVQTIRAELATTFVDGLEIVSRDICWATLAAPLGDATVTISPAPGG